MNLLQISPLMIKRDWFRVNVQHSPEKGVVAWNSPRELAKFTPPSAFENGDSQVEQYIHQTVRCSTHPLTQSPTHPATH